MKNVKGFTLIEIMIVFAIIGVLASIVIPAVTGKLTGNGYQNVSYGVGGMVEVRCIDGQKYTVSNGIATQIFANGGTVSCYNQ